MTFVSVTLALLKQWTVHLLRFDNGTFEWTRTQTWTSAQAPTHACVSDVQVLDFFEADMWIV